MLGLGKKSIRRSAISQIPSLHHEHASYKWWVLANVMIGTFMAVLDATIVDVALPKIMATFGISVDEVKWVATAYLLVLAVMLPTSGWIADRFGYKRIYFMGLSLFTLGSFLCGYSSSEASGGVPGPLLLQDHGDLVQYRNVWVVPLPGHGSTLYGPE